MYESADHTVTGEPAAPKLFVPVYEGDEMQPHAFPKSAPVNSLPPSPIFL